MTIAIAPDRTRLGWIGTGVMGASMCGRLMDAGFAVVVHNRSRSKAEGLIGAERSGPTRPAKSRRPPK